MLTKHRTKSISLHDQSDNEKGKRTPESGYGSGNGEESDKKMEERKRKKEELGTIPQVPLTGVPTYPPFSSYRVSSTLLKTVNAKFLYSESDQGSDRNGGSNNDENWPIDRDDDAQLQESIRVKLKKSESKVGVRKRKIRYKFS